MSRDRNDDRRLERRPRRRKKGGGGLSLKRQTGGRPRRKIVGRKDDAVRRRTRRGVLDGEFRPSDEELLWLLHEDETTVATARARYYWLAEREIAQELNMEKDRYHRILQRTYRLLRIFGGGKFELYSRFGHLLGVH